MVDNVLLDLYVRTTYQDAQVARRQIEKVQYAFTVVLTVTLVGCGRRRVVIGEPAHRLARPSGFRPTFRFLLLRAPMYRNRDPCRSGALSEILFAFGVLGLARFFYPDHRRQPMRNLIVFFITPPGERCVAPPSRCSLRRSPVWAFRLWVALTVISRTGKITKRNVLLDIYKSS